MSPSSAAKPPLVATAVVQDGELIGMTVVLDGTHAVRMDGKKLVEYTIQPDGTVIRHEHPPADIATALATGQKAIIQSIIAAENSCGTTNNGAETL